MKKKVVLAGLVSIENYGDHFIRECVDYLVKKNQREEIDTVFLDLFSAKKDLRFLLYGILRIIVDIIPNKNLAYKVLYFAMKIRLYRYYYNILKTADALIFFGGSFKYGTQSVWAQYSIAVECAEKLEIPVMFNAMNIQAYNESDWRCKCLQSHANFPCVRIITTRDGVSGVKKLRNDYKINCDIQILAVGDPAFWIPECYNVNKESGKVVGINLIRGDIYADYQWEEVSEEQMIKAYSELVQLLDDKGIEWEFFTNGLPADYEFGCKVLQNNKIKDKGKQIAVPRDADKLISLIVNYRGILGARLHACICAYSLDVPIAGFVWDEKMLRFAEMAGIKDGFLVGNEFTGEKLYENLEKGLNGQINKKIRERWKESTEKSISDFLNNI